MPTIAATTTIGGHGGDWAAQALAQDARVAAHIAPYYEEQAIIDAVRLALLRHTISGTPAPAPPPAASDRVTYAQLRTAAQFDPTAFRAFWRIMGMIGRPDEIYADPQIVAATREALRQHGREPALAQPSRAQLLAALTP